MKTRNQIRSAYDQIYREIVEVIQQMGGNDCIKQHRQRRSRLYQRLMELQKREHHLDQMENRLSNPQHMVY